MPQVTMSLTDKDVENADRIHDYTKGHSRAHAVSIALSMTAFLTNRLASGHDILLRDYDGVLSRVTMAEFDRTT